MASTILRSFKTLKNPITKTLQHRRGCKGKVIRFTQEKLYPVMDTQLPAFGFLKNALKSFPVIRNPGAIVFRHEANPNGL